MVCSAIVKHQAALAGIFNGTPQASCSLLCFIWLTVVCCQGRDLDAVLAAAEVIDCLVTADSDCCFMIDSD